MSKQIYQCQIPGPLRWGSLLDWKLVGHPIREDLLLGILDLMSGWHCSWMNSVSELHPYMSTIYCYIIMSCHGDKTCSGRSLSWPQSLECVIPRWTRHELLFSQNSLQIIGWNSCRNMDRRSSMGRRVNVFYTATSIDWEYRPSSTICSNWCNYFLSLCTLLKCQIQSRKCNFCFA